MTAGLVTIVAAVAFGLAVVVPALFSEGGPALPRLSRPSAGGASAEYLQDGTPVWVITHKDGRTSCPALIPTRHWELGSYSGGARFHARW